MVSDPHGGQDQEAEIHRDEDQQIDGDGEGENQKGRVEFTDQVSRRPPAIGYDIYGNGHRQEDGKVSQGQVEEPDHGDSAGHAEYSHPQHQSIAQDSSNTEHKQDGDGELAGRYHISTGWHLRSAILQKKKTHMSEPPMTSP